jgi:cytochrome c
MFKLKGLKMKSVFKIFSIVLLSIVIFPLASHAEGNAANGEGIAKKKCRVCHTFAKGEKAKIGPNLYGVHGNKAAQKEGYKYSKGIIAADLTWDDATLDAYLLKPRDVVKRGKMVFAGFRKKSDRDDVIAYLKTLKD